MEPPGCDYQIQIWCKKGIYNQPEHAATVAMKVVIVVYDEY